MRLVELRANKASFQTVKFRKQGLTLIVGSRTESGETYNGVGKSLIVELIHFCLGSRPNKEFERKLPGWAFTLVFELGSTGETHAATRETSKQTFVYLDDVQMRVPKFGDWIEERVFSIPADAPGLSFRSLLPHFVRRNIADYVDPRRAGYVTPFDVLMRNAFLLGVDVSLVAKKRALQKEKDNVKKLRDVFKDDPLLRQFYSGAGNADIRRAFLEEKATSLEQARDNFVVAQNYYELQKEVDQLAVDIEHQKNEAFLLNDAISNIDLSLAQQPEWAPNQVETLYGELRATFHEHALKRLEDVLAFHSDLLQMRVTRLSGEKLRLQARASLVNQEIQTKQTALNAKLRVLGDTGALDQYTALVNDIADLRAQIEKLREYAEIEVQNSNREAALESELSQEVIKTNSYLEQTRSAREETFQVFKAFVARFYPGAEAGISLRNNEGPKNQIRFDLDVSVPSDSADGINEVRIFCYDLTILAARKNHRMQFVFHDSRLFANMDVRQRATLFRLAHEVASKQGLQYVATLNPDEISGMESEFTADEFQAIIGKSVVLELKDDPPAGKLLGIQVDMRYDSRK